MNKKIISILLVLTIATTIFVVWTSLYYNNIEDNQITINEGIPFSPNKAPSFEDTFLKDLTSYVWIWDETHKGTGPDSLSEGKIVPKNRGLFTITFTKNGHVIGTTDCNDFSGTYTLKDGVISFGNFLSTKKFCEGSQETEFLGMIREGVLGIGDNNLYIEHNQTVIFDKGRKI